MTAIELPQTVPECHALIRSLLERLDKAERRIEELERQLKRNSRNSSLPPSADPPDAPPRKAKEPTGRSPGGQPGHKGHKRELVPPERVDQFEHVWPERCEQCSYELSRAAHRVQVGDPFLHQVTEIPPARARVVEYQLFAQQCPKCDHATSAALPPGVTASSFGSRMQAVVSLLSGLYRLSRRTAQGLVADLFDVRISLGAIIACEQRTSEALAAPVAQVREYIQQQERANADETSWRVGGRKAWLWVAVTASATAFLIHARRGAEGAKKLLGAFAGILVSDRWSAYATHKLRRRQLCWAHLARHFEDFAQYPGPTGTIGGALVLLTEQLFRHWHQARDETWSRAKLQKTMAPLRRSIEELLQRGCVCGHSRVEATCKDLLHYGPALWTFLRVPGVEPTNNAAERALRPAVIMRKTSFGSHSEEGSRFIERMLTTVATLRQQRRDVVAYIEETCERAALGRSPRSLLPEAKIMSHQVVARALAMA